MELPKDCIEQIGGYTDGRDWDIVDDLTFVLFNAPNFQGKNLNVCFDSGIVEVIGDDGQSIDERYAIEIKLHKLSPTTPVLSGTEENQ